MSSPAPGGDRTPLLRAALEYAAAGVPVFPCVPLGKAPLTRQGFKDASRDPSQLARWWRWQPEANIGLVTGSARSRIDIFDIDVHPGGDGFDALVAAEKAGLIDTWSRIVRSPSGGLHLVFPREPVSEAAQLGDPDRTCRFPRRRQLRPRTPRHGYAPETGRYRSVRGGRHAERIPGTGRGVAAGVSTRPAPTHDDSTAAAAAATLSVKAPGGMRNVWRIGWRAGRKEIETGRCSGLRAA